MATAPTLRERLVDLLAIDLRSLAAVRIAAGCVVLVDLALRTRDWSALYAEGGVLPAAALEALNPRARWFSIHAWASGHAPAEIALVALAAAAALALALGWRTRSATALSWYLLSSLQARNPWAASMGGDHMLRVLLLWLVLLPSGARCSLDARRAGGGPLGNRFTGIAGAGLLLQIALVYWATGLQKSGGLWRDGRALFYALSLDVWVTPLGAWLRERAAILPLLTHLVRGFELFGPFIPFLPVRNDLARIAAVASFALLHLGLALCFSIGLFPLEAMVGWLAFLPGSLWDRLAPRSSAPPGAPPLRAGLPLQIAAALLLTYAAAFALPQSLGRGNPLPGPLRLVGSALRMNATWSMFAPNPPALDSWPVLDGATADGARVDPLRDAPVAWDKPKSIPALFPSFRWRLYFGNLVGVPDTLPGRRDALEAFASYWCRDWNARHAPEQRLRTLDVAIGEERTLEQGVAEPERALLYRGVCPR